MVGFFVSLGSCSDPSNNLLLAMVAPTKWDAFYAGLKLTGDQFFDSSSL
jgi:hypothetical protein